MIICCLTSVVAIPGRKQGWNCVVFVIIFSLAFIPSSLFSMASALWWVHAYSLGEWNRRYEQGDSEPAIAIVGDCDCILSIRGHSFSSPGLSFVFGWIIGSKERSFIKWIFPILMSLINRLVQKYLRRCDYFHFFVLINCFQIMTSSMQQQAQEQQLLGSQVKLENQEPVVKNTKWEFRCFYSGKAVFPHGWIIVKFSTWLGWLKADWDFSENASISERTGFSQTKILVEKWWQM